VRVFTAPGPPQFSIPLYRGEIVCCAVSPAFGLVACGTRDGFVVMCSLYRRAIARVIDLHGKSPCALLVTDGWGFVVVCCKAVDRGEVEHTIEVYSVNGEFVRRKTVPTAVTAWTSWRSSHGFDFLLFAGEQGKVMCCEVFRLEVVNVPGCRAPSGIVALRYAKDEMAVVVACRNGEVMFCPFNHV
jgi:hypothetical protein